MDRPLGNLSTRSRFTSTILDISTRKKKRHANSICWRTFNRFNYEIGISTVIRRDIHTYVLLLDIGNRKGCSKNKNQKRSK